MPLIKKIALAAALVSTLSLTACLQGGQDAQETATTHIRVRANVPSISVSGSLAKGSVVTYSMVIVTLISNSNTPTASDTIRDTILAGISQGLGASSTTDQTIDSNYTLKALRNWTVRVTVSDTKGTITHDTTIVPAANNYTRIGDTVSVSINKLNPKFTQYRAIFSNLPDSISTNATGNTTKQAVRFTRLILRVDGQIVRDSLKADYFNGNPIDTLDYDYVALGQRTIRLAAYGVLLNAAGAVVKTDTLFVGETTVISVPGVNNDPSNLTLNWTNVAGNLGNEKLTVVIGQVGRTTVTGTTSGVGVVPKR
jgi:hypothetical protein